MNILLIHQVKNGRNGIEYGAVPYYRMQKPNEVLTRLHPEFDFITSNSANIEDELLKQTDLAIFTRIAHKEDIERLEKFGIKWAVDVDDYWHLPKDHLLYQAYQDNGTVEKIENTLRNALFVISSTEILAEKIKPFNKNVHVIENGIDSVEWQSRKIKSNRVRFGFTQGTTHISDIKLISKSVADSLYTTEFYNKGQIVLCGFNANFNEPSIYVGYEKMLTDNMNPLKIVDQQYVRRLIKISEPNGISKPYRRISAVHVKDFHLIHDELDVIVAPLAESEFNSCKSNIKMLEAGFGDCAVMCHDVQPYSGLMTKENSFSLTEKSFFDWQKYILNNVSILADKKVALKESVQKFELTKLTQKRKELYESVSN